MAEQNEILVNIDLLHDVADRLDELIADYKQKFNGYVNCGRWNENLNDLIATYNAIALLIDRKPVKKIEKT